MIRARRVADHFRTLLQKRCFHHSRIRRHNEKLRVLFCGSDPFSAESLKALHAEAQLADTTIASIDVVTKSDKRAGRGLKVVKPPAIKPIAQELKLPLHQIDTFRGWSPPPVDLIIAVSFGLLIPSRILNASKYSGLNVHPSLLPELRGAAPIHWAIIRGLRDTGVSIQTLHPTKFDHGVIIDQTARMPIPDNATYHTLASTLAPIGAALLVNALRSRLYLPPLRDVEAPASSSLAPRISTQDRFLDCSSQTAEELARRARALTKLYAVAESSDGQKFRLQFLDVEACPRKADLPKGIPYALIDKSRDVKTSDDPIYINTSDGCVRVPTMVVEGRIRHAAAQSAAQVKLFKRQRPEGDKILHMFQGPLTMA